jgi:hypothetical protein
MVVVVLLIALVMILGGGAATFFGSDILLADRGLPMVVAGAVVASGGAILLGLGFVVRGLQRLEGHATQIRDGIADLRAANLAAAARPPQRVTATEAAPAALVPPAPEVTAAPMIAPTPPDMPAPTRAEPADRTEEGAALVVPDVSPDTREADQEADSGSVVGRYSSGGNDYTMYADGSITAETPSGRHRFKSLDELKAFVGGGGETG